MSAKTLIHCPNCNSLRECPVTKDVSEQGDGHYFNKEQYWPGPTNLFNDFLLAFKETKIFNLRKRCRICSHCEQVFHTAEIDLDDYRSLLKSWEFQNSNWPVIHDELKQEKQRLAEENKKLMQELTETKKELRRSVSKIKRIQISVKRIVR